MERNGASGVLRGNHTARIDEKGRLKIPNAFRGLIEGQHGADVFVTSLSGESVRIYPMPVWMALEEKLARKNEVLSELMEEHVKLKKELGEP